MSPWLLPGPVSFMESVSAELRDGQNLILACPRDMLPGLTRCLSDRLLDDGWSVAEPLSDDGSEPLDLLFGALALDDQKIGRRTVSLLRQRLKAGQVVLIEGVDPRNWDRWRRFLYEYEVASRGVSSFERPLVVVVTSGVPLDDLPVRAAALRVLPWNDVIGEIDLLIFATHELRHQGLVGPRVKLHARMIARLALWDIELAEFLLLQPATELFEPTVAMNRASERLERGASLTDATWESGGVQVFDGVTLIHPWLLVRNDAGTKELRARLWSAHAAEILPVLELHRRALAQRIKSKVRFPIRLGDEELRDIDDLEIGQLAHVAGRADVSRSDRNALHRLRRLRNKLAHLEPLSADEALEPDLLVPDFFVTQRSTT